MDPAVTFTLDRYEPVAFHTYPALMRPAEADARCSAARSGPTCITTPRACREGSAEPVDAYLVGIDATDVLRAQLADFLDAAGARQDVRVSVGVSSGSAVEWVLRDAVPYGVRALPRYPRHRPAGRSGGRRWRRSARSWPTMR